MVFDLKSIFHHLKLVLFLCQQHKYEYEIGLNRHIWQVLGYTILIDTVEFGCRCSATEVKKSYHQAGL